MFTDLENKQSWKECFSVSGVRLPTGYYIGVSAVTGDLSDNHDIIGVRFYELETDKVRLIVSISRILHVENEIYCICILMLQKDDEDRSNIIPSAESFQAPRGELAVNFSLF